MKRNPGFFILALTLVLTACFSPWKDDKGAFSVSIGIGNSQGDIPSLPAPSPSPQIQDLLHVVKVSAVVENQQQSTGGGQGSVQKQEARFIGAQTVYFTVAPGHYNIDVTAYKIDGDIPSNLYEIATSTPEVVVASGNSGGNPVHVQAGKKTTVVITMAAN